MSKLTKRLIDALKPEDADYFEWDDELRGFGLRVSPKGAKTFLVQYRAGGRTRRVKIGRYGTLTAEEARILARELLGDVAKGENPAEDISSHRKAPTLKDVCERFLRDHVGVRLKPITARDYKATINKIIIPELGSRKIVDIARPDIADLHHRYRARPYQANRIVSVLSKLFNLTEIWGLRPDGSNPCRHVNKFPEGKRERFLSSDEIKRLGEVLSEAEALYAAGRPGGETPYVVAAFRLLMLTGCRLSEIQFLQWGFITATHIALPDSKTGARKVPLPPAAIEVLKTIPRIDGNRYVIAGTVPGESMKDLEKPWRRIRAKAGLEDVRIHDLRHTYASNAVMSGLSIPMVGKILGHSQIQTTMRYAHFADEPVREAADKVSQQLGALLGTGSTSQSVKAPPLRVVR
jgi:integrase